MDKKGFIFFSDAINVILIVLILIFFSVFMYFIDLKTFDDYEQLTIDQSFEGDLFQDN